MQLFLADYVTLARKWLDDSLLRKGVERSLLRISEQLPPLISEACWEFDLSTPSSGCDFSVGVIGDRETKRKFATALSELKPLPFHAAIHRWLNPRCLLASMDSDLFLEFDFRQGIKRHGPRTIFAVKEASDVGRLVRSTRQKEQIHKIVSKLPASGELKHLYYHPIKRSAARAVVYLPNEAIEAYLSNLGREDYLKPAKHILDQVPDDALVGLHLDLLRAPVNLGFEVYTEPLKDEEGTLDAFYSYLEKNKICSNATKKLLTRWTDVTDAASKDLLTTRQTITKFVCSKNALLEAKGYLGYMIGFQSLN